MQEKSLADTQTKSGVEKHVCDRTCGEAEPTVNSSLNEKCTVPLKDMLPHTHVIASSNNAMYVPVQYHNLVLLLQCVVLLVEPYSTTVL